MSENQAHPERSDVGNLYAYLKKIQAANPGSYAYESGNWNDYAQWQVMVKAKLFELMSYFPRNTPLSPKTLQTIDRNGYRQEEIEFTTAPGVTVRGTVTIPAAGPGPYPAIVALHDHSGFYYLGREKIVEVDNEPDFLTEFKKNAYSGASWASALARRGYVTLAIDAFYFGSRRLRLEDVSEEMQARVVGERVAGLKAGTREYVGAYNRICLDFEPLVVRYILVAGSTWPGILFHDDRRSIDYLHTRAEVDRSRIGCCGLSIGGLRSAFLAALDSRVSCAVVVGWMVSLAALLFNRVRDHTFMLYVPGMTRYLDLPDLMSSFAPKPLLVQQCSRDSLYTLEAMSSACDTIGRVYRKIGYEKRFESRFYDNGHEFNARMQQEAFAFLDRWLRNG